MFKKNGALFCVVWVCFIYITQNFFTLLVLPTYASTTEKHTSIQNSSRDYKNFANKIEVSAETKLKKKFTYRIRGELETLDWTRAKTFVEGSILLNLMEGLVSINSDLEVIPALAQSWQISSDQKRYTFKLRPGVEWADGKLLKAQHFVDSWRRLLSPLTAAAYAYYLFDIEGAEDFNAGKLSDFSKVGVTAIDDYTLQIKLNQPTTFWIQVMAFWVTFPIRKDLIDKYGSSWTTPGRLVTLGPYHLEAHDQNLKYVLRSNPKYYREKGNVDEIVSFIMQDDDEALNFYEKGEIDFLSDISVVNLKRLKNHPDLKLFHHLKTLFLGFNPDIYPLSNLTLRKAIAMSIDKKKLCDALSGKQYPATSFVPPPLEAYNKQMGYSYDPVQAKEILKLSGLSSSEKLKLEYILPDWDKSKLIGQRIQEDLKKNLNIDVTMKFLENKQYRAQLELYAYPLFDLSWTADYPDPYSFLAVYLSNAGNGSTTWKSKKYDVELPQAKMISQRKDREKKYRDLQKFLLEEEIVQVPLCYEPNLVLAKPGKSGYELNPLDFFYLRMVNVNP